MADERKGSLKEEIARLTQRLAAAERDIERLELRNRFYATLFDAIQDEIMVIDHSYAIRDVNQAFLDHNGLKKEEALGRKCHEVIYNSEGPCEFGDRFCPLKEARDRLRRVDVTHYRRTGAGPPKEILRIMCPLSSGKAAPEYFIEISRDLTEYRSLIRRVAVSEKKFKAILDTATDAILSIDADHRIILFNDAAERIFGYGRDEVLGKDLGLLIPPQYGDHFQYVKRFLETRYSKVMGGILSLNALGKGGRQFPIELSLSYHETDGEITFTAIVRDMTAQRQLEKNLLQAERLAAVGNVVARVAHEIKNPLMAIGGLSLQVRKAVKETKAVQKLDVVLDEVNRLERLVAQLGDFTKEHLLMTRKTDVNAVVRDVLKMMEETHPGERYRFAERLDADLGDIECDPDKLKEVLMNVVMNGIQAMEQGGTLEVSTRKWDGGVEIAVADEGEGMDGERIDRMFEPFFTTKRKGSGLGLPICFRIVKAHGGGIWAESRPGLGTTFFIRLPRKPV